MYRTFKYRLWTNANQERELGIMLETHRRLYNAALEQRIASWKNDGKTVGWYEQNRWFTSERKTNPYYARINNSSGQATLRRLDQAYKRFFERIKGGDTSFGPPGFQSRDDFNSFDFPCSTSGATINFNHREDRLRVQHVGTIRICLHRPIRGVIKTTTVKRHLGKWYVIFLCEILTPPPEPSIKPPVGIDVGLESFLTTSDGESESNPRYLKDALPELRRRQRSLCRKKKGGSNRRKARLKVAKHHARVANLRREHHHKVALKLVRRYGKIAAESLDVQDMVRNGRFSRSILDAGWSDFLKILKHKAEKAGVQVVKVDPRGTSQECSRCGEKVPKDLRVRHHDCPHCGLSLHRDHNAALNILARAGLARTEPVQDNVSRWAERPVRSRLLFTEME